MCKICAFLPQKPTKRQKFYIFGRSRYGYIPPQRVGSLHRIKDKNQQRNLQANKLTNKQTKQTIIFIDSIDTVASVENICSSYAFDAHFMFEMQTWGCFCNKSAIHLWLPKTFNMLTFFCTYFSDLRWHRLPKKMGSTQISFDPKPFLPP